MLDYMRQHSRSLVIYFFFAIIIVVFVVQFGPQSSGWTPADVAVAANVDGEAIDATDIDMEYTRHYGWSFARNQELTEVMAQKRALLDDLIKVRVLAGLAGKLGLVATKTDLHDFILDEKRNIDRASFSTDGKFDADLYRRVITSGYRSSMKRYERARSHDLAARRLLEFLAAQPRVPNADVDEEWRLRNTKVNLEFVAFEPGDEPEPAQPTADEAAAWAKDHETEVKEYYDAHKTDYDRPRELRLRQIFKKADADNPKAWEAARAASAELRTRIEKGEDMAELAKEHSDHFSYKEQGGDMGWQTKGNADPAFDEAAFALAAGQLSGVVETPTGFYVLRAEEIRDAVKRALDDVRSEIAAILLVEARRKEAASKRAAEVLAQAKAGAPLAELVVGLNTAPVAEEPDAAPDPAEGAPVPAAAYTLEETGPFSQEGGNGDPDPLNPFRFQRAWDTIPRIGRSSGLSRAAFALTSDSPWPEAPVEVSGTSYIFRLKERTEPDAEELETKRDTLRLELAAAKADLLLGPWERALFARAFQRRMFGKEPKLGLWLQPVVKKGLDTTSIDVDESLFRLEQAPQPEAEPGEAKPDGAKAPAEAAAPAKEKAAAPAKEKAAAPAKEKAAEAPPAPGE